MAAGVLDQETVKMAEQRSKEVIQGAADKSGLSQNLLVVNIAKFALGGMLLGAVYGTAKGTAEQQGILHELKYPTKAFDRDLFASRLFKQLEAYEHLQPESYRLAVLYCDQLFQLERRLAQPHERPRDSDLPKAKSCIDGVLGHIMVMRNHSQSGEQRGEINKLKIQINEVLGDHRKLIYARCATLRL